MGEYVAELRNFPQDWHKCRSDFSKSPEFSTGHGGEQNWTTESLITFGEAFPNPQQDFKSASLQMRNATVVVKGHIKRG